VAAEIMGISISFEPYVPIHMSREKTCKDLQSKKKDCMCTLKGSGEDSHISPPFPGLDFCLAKRQMSLGGSCLAVQKRHFPPASGHALLSTECMYRHLNCCNVPV